MEPGLSLMLLLVYRPLFGWIASGSLLFGILGYFLAGTKGNGCWGCLLGLLLGPLGLLIAMLIPGRR